MRNSCVFHPQTSSIVVVASLSFVPMAIFKIQKKGSIGQISKVES